jgi:plasmid rolling circle replication initiator protein Rep
MTIINDIDRSVQYEEAPIYDTGVILEDGKTDWQDQKLKSLAVSKVFKSNTKEMLKRSIRVFECANILAFAHDPKTNKRKLQSVWFCKDRMCPMCQKRRSLVVFHQVKNVCSAISKDFPTYKYLLLTFTVPNVKAEDLSDKISDMAKAWKRLILRKEFTKAIKGWFRTLEVTYNPERDDYHPHYHVLVCVPSGYFKKSYIKRDRWVGLWQEAMRDYSITQVDVRVIKPNPKKQGSDAISSVAAEVGKYATKPSDYLVKTLTEDRYRAVPNVVQDLAESLTRRKLVAFGGLMLKYSKLLNLQDVDSDSVDLIHTDGESEQTEAIAFEIYRWNIGFNNYVC